jgi:hypothetical protein
MARRKFFSGRVSIRSETFVDEVRGDRRRSPGDEGVMA